jgi:hypothetical protein
MYLLIRHSVNFALLALVLVFVSGRANQAAALPFPAGLACDSRLTALFAPRAPLLGRYEVCTTAQPLANVLPSGWTVEHQPPLDAFGGAGRYDRSAVLRLYGGQRPSVSRGWIREGERYESLTFISPHPNASLTRLEAGTLVIRFII